MENSHLVLFFLTIIFATFSDAESAGRLLRQNNGTYNHHSVAGIDCISWRLAVETNNVVNWTVVPEACHGYIRHYMLDGQYPLDCNTVADSATQYAQSLNLTGDGKDVWVFDIDETTLSNFPYNTRPDIAFGSFTYNATKFDMWVAEGKATAVPGSVKLYKKLVSLGIKIVFLSEARERNVTIANLKAVGFKSWDQLILQKASDTSSLVAYKSKERGKLEAEGYRIVGNMGDQWSDITGTNVGMRIFKVPNPMYYLLP